MKRFRAPMILFCMIFISFLGSADDEKKSSVSKKVSGESANASAAEEARHDNSAKEGSQINELIADRTPEVRLGVRLFYENRLSNPGANLASSCRTCHVPPEASRGNRNFSDVNAFSVIPSSGKNTAMRNTPSLMDVSLQASFNADGRYSTLEEALRAELVSPHLGWLPDQVDIVKNEIFALLLNDQGEDMLAEGTYIEQFQAVKGVDLEKVNADKAFELVIESLVDYLNTLVTHNTSAYDAMTFLNRFNESLSGPNDTPQELSGRVFGRVANQEGRVLIRFPNIYTEEAYLGYKTFMRVEPTYNSTVFEEETNIGNCVACHIPPKFTDMKFHNTGVVQDEYDKAHGDGAFSKLSISEPSENTRFRIYASDPSKVDLGRWNVEPSEKNIAAFKTPMLRNIEKSDPYLHNGMYDNLEDVIRQKIRVSELAKAGKLVNPDPEYLKMNISEKDVPHLAAFLRTLNEVPEEEFRDFRIENVRIRQDPKGEQSYKN
jgi:cytochrome c peroxidase